MRLQVVLQAGYSRYSWIQLDIYGYSWIQWDTAGYSGSAAKWLDIVGIQHTAQYHKDMVRYKQDTGEIQAGDPKNTRQGRAQCIMIMAPHSHTWHTP